MAGAFFHLFAYGTLAGKGSASELMAGCERVASAAVRGTLYDIGEYPALLLSGSDRVEGEIWRCPADLLPRLDHYESVRAGLFRRVGVTVEGMPCWAYVAGPSLGPRLRPEARVRPGALNRAPESTESRWR